MAHDIIKITVTLCISTFVARLYLLYRYAGEQSGYNIAYGQRTTHQIVINRYNVYVCTKVLFWDELFCICYCTAHSLPLCAPFIVYADLYDSFCALILCQRNIVANSICGIMLNNIFEFCSEVLTIQVLLVLTANISQF